MAGLIQQLAELNRQTVAKDLKFFRQFVYYFELRVPPSAGAADPTYIYPLALAPESTALSEPYAVDVAFGDLGGLFVEERGVIARELTIEGSTGWASRKLPSLGGNPSLPRLPAKPSFDRRSAAQTSLVHAISGQKHLQFLQDTVFRTYGDLKRDPATSEGTELYWHNPKDDEHWRCFPRRFDLRRDKSRPLEYQYSIQLTLVRGSSTSEVRFSEDKVVFDVLRDPDTMLRAGLAGIRAAITDLALVQNEVKALNSGFVSLLDGAVGIADDTEALLDGTASIIASPFNLVENSVRAGLDALLELETGVRDQTAVGPPANLLNAIRGIVDSLVMIGSYPEKFQSNVQAAVDRYQERQQLAQSRRSDTLTAAVERGPPSSIQSFSTPQDARAGDYLRARNQAPLGISAQRFPSAFDYVVQQGDTLANLAARFLDDARQWRHIALFNDLVFPFISETRAAGTVRVGDTIRIPSAAPAASTVETSATFGVRTDETAEVRALGRDYQMDHVGSGFYDLVVDTEGGSVDFKRVEGRANLAQGLRARLITTRGTDPLYRRVGCGRTVGLGITEVDFEMAQFRLLEGVQADPRVAGIRELSVDTPSPDTINARIVAEVRGLTEPERINVGVGGA